MICSICSTELCFPSEEDHELCLWHLWEEFALRNKPIKRLFRKFWNDYGGIWSPIGISIVFIFGLILLGSCVIHHH